MSEIQAGEAVDGRVRTWIDPVRVVWCGSGAEKVDLLLAPKKGQVCEGYFGESVGTVLRGKDAAFILDFGRELHGGVQLGISPNTFKGAKLRLRFGESVSETMSSVGDGSTASNDHAVRDCIIGVPWFGQLELGNTGYRFLRIDLVEGERVGLEFVRAVSLMRSMVPIGWFKSSDDRLNRIFNTAVRTVSLCCQEYLWDGIKRDRLVWMGDVHPELKTIVNVFGAAEVVPQSLDYMAEVTPPDRWMNTMPTYTLWWIRNLAEWYRFTGDRVYLAKHGPYLAATFDHVLAQCESGCWNGGCFLDWPTHDLPEAERMGTQGLVLIAAQETAMMAEDIGLEDLKSKAIRLVAELRKLNLVCTESKSASALLALSGLRDPVTVYKEALSPHGHMGISTFYGYYVLEAMSAAGKNHRALETIRDYWGGMLDMGATSFWEDFDLGWTNNAFRIDEMPVAGKKDIHGDFGAYCYKGFRHSLCHGWSSGPAAWCINHILGIRPLDIGCRTLEIDPFLGDLEWAEGAMALPDGKCVRVRISRDTSGELIMDVVAPEGVVIHRSNPSDTAAATH